MLYVLPPPAAPPIPWPSLICASSNPGTGGITHRVQEDPWGVVTAKLVPTEGRPPPAKSLRLRRESGATVSTDDEDGFRNKSLSECYFAGKGTALVLPPNERVRVSRRVSNSGSDIQQHLQSMFYLLRPEETLKMAVKLESVHPCRTRYLVVVSCQGRQDAEECCLLGIDCNERTTVGLVLRVLADTAITLDGDGGFSVTVCGRHHIFKPVSVQAMWSALQTLHKVSSKAREQNYFMGGLTHDWVSYYEGRVESDRSCLNEWHAMDSLESRRPPSPDSVRCKPSERDETERVIRCKLKEIMMSVDLDEVTSKHIRGRLEEDLDMDLGEYKPFIDQEMLTILGQMDAATEIFDHVYLGSEWNASNHEELQKNGVRHILNVTREIDNFFPGMFDYLNVRVYDDEKTDLLKHWDDTFKYISRARSEGSKVLVHCKMGVSRSASVVIAYAMKAFGWDFKTAFDYVKRKRSCIKPNGSFISQLETYQGILDAMKNREKLQRSKSETNLKSPPIGGRTSMEKPSGPPVDTLQSTGSSLARTGARPKSWSPDNTAASVLIPSPETQAPLSMSLEQLEWTDACTCRCTRRSSHVRVPCGDSQYSVSPNRVVYLPSVRRRVSELERKAQPDRRGLALPLAPEEGWDPGPTRPSRQSSWSSYDSAVVLEASSSRQSSWGALPSRNSSWGSYDMRPAGPGTVRRTKQRIEETAEVPLVHYASSPTLSSLEPAVSGLVQNLKKEFEAKSASNDGRTDAKSLPSSPVSSRESPPLEDLSVRHLVGHYEAQPSHSPPKVEKVVFVLPKPPAPSAVVASVVAKAAVKKKQQGKTHPLAHLTIAARHQNAVYNTM